MIQSWRAWHLLKVAWLLVVVGLLLTVGGGAWHRAEGGAVETAAGGSALIGKLEGPEIMTDRAQFPTSFHEAPAWRISSTRASYRP